MALSRSALAVAVLVMLTLLLAAPCYSQSGSGDDIITTELGSGSGDDIFSTVPSFVITSTDDAPVETTESPRRFTRGAIAAIVIAAVVATTAAVGVAAIVVWMVLKAKAGASVAPQAADTTELVQTERGNGGKKGKRPTNDNMTEETYIGGYQ